MSAFTLRNFTYEHHNFREARTNNGEYLYCLDDFCAYHGISKYSKEVKQVCQKYNIEAPYSDPVFISEDLFYPVIACIFLAFKYGTEVLERLSDVGEPLDVLS